MDGDKIVFDLEGKRFAIDSRVIECIIDTEYISFLPNPPSCVNGVITHHNHIVIVADLAAILRLTVVKKTPYRIIIINVDGIFLGVNAGDALISLMRQKDCNEVVFQGDDNDYILGVMNPISDNIKLIDHDALLELVARSLRYHKDNRLQFQ